MLIILQLILVTGALLLIVLCYSIYQNNKTDLDKQSERLLKKAGKMPRYNRPIINIKIEAKDWQWFTLYGLILVYIVVRIISNN